MNCTNRSRRCVTVPTDTERTFAVSVIIPARNEAPRIDAVVRAVLDQAASGSRVEVLVADDGSTDGTASLAARAGARVLPTGGGEGNPAAARNLAAREATGDILLFLDGDCLPDAGWLHGHLQAHGRGYSMVGGSLSLPPGLSWTARGDYYASAYHVHPRRGAGVVRHHTPANLSVRKDLFGSTPGFTERLPVADGHEELEWQAALDRRGVRLYFEPSAAARHFNRPGLGNLVRRTYRWGYSALEAKSGSGTARLSSLYRSPALALVLAYPLALLETGYITGTWLMAKKPAVLQFVPMILLSRLVYATAFVLGGWRWLVRSPGLAGARPRWR